MIIKTIAIAIILTIFTLTTLVLLYIKFKRRLEKKMKDKVANLEMQLFHKNNAYDSFKVMNELIITYISIDLNNLKYVTDNSFFTDADADELTTKTFYKLKRHLNPLYLKSLSTYINVEHLDEFIIERIYNNYIDLIRNKNRKTTDVVTKKKKNNRRGVN